VQRWETRTGVLGCKTKWSKKGKGWGDLEPVLVTIARLPNEKIWYSISYSCKKFCSSGRRKVIRKKESAISGRLFLEIGS
jgi:hypothetical protein